MEPTRDTCDPCGSFPQLGWSHTPPLVRPWDRSWGSTHSCLKVPVVFWSFFIFLVMMEAKVYIGRGVEVLCAGKSC